jgi:hypothetical protein
LELSALSFELSEKSSGLSAKSSDFSGTSSELSAVSSELSELSSELLVTSFDLGRVRLALYRQSQMLWPPPLERACPGLSEFLCVRHTMTNDRSLYAKQEEVCGRNRIASDRRDSEGITRTPGAGTDD